MSDETSSAATPWHNVESLSATELKHRIVLPLLASMPAIDEVENMSPADGSGLDAVFVERGEIRNTTYGLIVRKGDIRGSGTEQQSVGRAVSQLELPTVKGRVATPSGSKYLDGIILAFSGRISDAARAEVRTRVNPDLSYTFWDEDQLAKLVKRHLPELLNVADAFIVAYLKPLIAELNSLDTLDQIPGVAKRTLTQIYEEPQLKRKFDPSIAPVQGTTMLPEKDERNTQVRLPSAAVEVMALQLPALKRNAVVIADVAAGKTVLLKMIALRLSHDCLAATEQGPATRIPVYLRARNVLKHQSVRDAIAHEFHERKVDDLSESLDHDLTSGRYVVLLDGFSELLLEEQKARLHEMSAAFCTTYPQAQFIVAGRPPDFLEPKYFLNHMHYAIKDFSAKQVSSLLNRWTSDSPTLGDVAKKLVTRVREALQLPGSPISATIGVMLYEQEKRFITNISEAVDRYMVIRLGRYSRELGIIQEVEWTRKQDILAEIAFQMIENDEEALPEAEFVRRVNAFYDRLDEEPKGEVVLLELLDNGVLSSSGSDVYFFRSAFRDFFAAHHINTLSDRNEFFRRQLTSRKWGLALVFAAGLERKNSELLKLLVQDVEKLGQPSLDGIGPDYLYAAYLVGRILSNSEGADKASRVLTLQVCLDACVGTIPGFAAEAKAQFGNIGEIAALIGVEHTFFATVGVPFLGRQFRSFADASALSNEKRYLAASTYAQLGLTNSVAVLDSALKATDDTKVLLALHVLVRQILKGRNLRAAEQEEFKALERRVKRKLNKPIHKKEVTMLLKMKSKLIALETQRMRRITAGE